MLWTVTHDKSGAHSLASTPCCSTGHQACCTVLQALQQGIQQATYASLMGVEGLPCKPLHLS